MALQDDTGRENSARPRTSNEYMCPICKLKSDDRHCYHYGGISCYSCRAFFRRAHQGTKTPEFRCKKDNNCEITVKTRRKCQKCRYILCLKAGMDPELVLNEDQKKIRFRNFLKKKAANQGNNDKNGEGQQDSSDRRTSRSPVSGEETSNGAKSMALSCNQQQQQEQQQQTVMAQSRARAFGTHHNESSYLPVLAVMQQKEQQHWQQLSVKQENNPVDSTNEAAYIKCLQATILEQRKMQDEYGNYKRVAFSIRHGLEDAPEAKIPKFSPDDHRHALSQRMSTRPTSVMHPEEFGVLPHRIISPSLYSMRESPMSSSAASTISSDHSTESTPPLAMTPTDLSMNGDPGRTEDMQDQVHKQSGSNKLEDQMEEIQQNYFLSMAQIDMSPVFVESLQEFHTGNKSRLTKQEFREHIFRIASQFKLFAHKQATFCAFSKVDQELLLTRNTTLFINYILGRYIGSETGEEQLQWMLDANLPQNLSGTRPEKISFNEFNEQLHMFEVQEDDYDFEKGSRIIQETKLIHHCTGLVAHMILYYSDLQMKLENATKVQSLFIETVELIKQAHIKYEILIEVEPILRMLRELQKMARVFGKSFHWDAIEDCSNMNYLEQDNWIASNLSWFQTAMDEVPLPLQLARGVTGVGGPPPPDVLLSSLVDLFFQRSRSIVRHLPEFQALPPETQSSLWARNSLAAVALCLAKLECAGSVDDQMRMLTGNSDRSSFPCLAQFGGISVSSLFLAASNKCWDNDNCSLTRRDADVFCFIVEQVSEVLRDEEVFKLLMVILLFGGEVGFLDTEISRVQNSYMRILILRLEEESEERIKTAIKDLESLAFVIPRIK